VDVPAGEMEFGYDFSRLHRRVKSSCPRTFDRDREPAALRAIARESLAFRKRTQPLESSSAGCIFQNPDPARDVVPQGFRRRRARWSIAPAQGAREGAARVSPTHANFIVKRGGATARDIRALIRRCQSEVHARFGVTLREEIVYLVTFRELIVAQGFTLQPV
jgi:UDP-N-acetylmuramate dehydrogenase